MEIFNSTESKKRGTELFQLTDEFYVKDESTATPSGSGSGAPPIDENTFTAVVPSGVPSVVPSNGGKRRKSNVKKSQKKSKRRKSRRNKSSKK